MTRGLIRFKSCFFHIIVAPPCAKSRSAVLTRSREVILHKVGRLRGGITVFRRLELQSARKNGRFRRGSRARESATNRNSRTPSGRRAAVVLQQSAQPLPALDLADPNGVRRWGDLRLYNRTAERCSDLWSSRCHQRHGSMVRIAPFRSRSATRC